MFTFQRQFECDFLTLSACMYCPDLVSRVEAQVLMTLFAVMICVVGCILRQLYPSCPPTQVHIFLSHRISWRTNNQRQIRTKKQNTKVTGSTATGNIHTMHIQFWLCVNILINRSSFFQLYLPSEFGLYPGQYMVLMSSYLESWMVQSKGIVLAISGLGQGALAGWYCTPSVWKSEDKKHLQMNTLKTGLCTICTDYLINTYRYDFMI